MFQGYDGLTPGTVAPVGVSFEEQIETAARTMPEISRFLGVVIAMYYREHAPPHFHAVYGDYGITVRIKDGVVQGRFPRRALRLVLEWYSFHQAELLENWRLARERKPLRCIAPLE